VASSVAFVAIVQGTLDEPPPRIYRVVLPGPWPGMVAGLVPSSARLCAMSLSPTGMLIVLAAGGYRAVVVELGAGLRRLSLNGAELLDGYRSTEMPSAGRGAVLLPWPNRIRDGRYTYGGRTRQLPINEVPKSTAIHGLTRWRPWLLHEVTPERARLRCELLPQPGYEFALEAVVEYSLDPETGLQVSTTVGNAGTQPAPFGLGFHPYLRVGGETIDSATLRVPAAEHLVCDERGLPVRMERVAGTRFDLRPGVPLAGVQLDDCFGGLQRDADGLARADLDGADGQRVSFWCDDAFGWLMVFTQDLPGDVPKRGGVAVEPMTCPVDAFNSGTDVIDLAPGAEHVSRWGIRAGEL
jgi:aldose 1-epimerase